MDLRLDKQLVAIIAQQYPQYQPGIRAWYNQANVRGARRGDGAGVSAAALPNASQTPGR
jgi:hypothetical protein